MKLIVPLVDYLPTLLWHMLENNCDDDDDDSSWCHVTLGFLGLCTPGCRKCKVFVYTVLWCME